MVQLATKGQRAKAAASHIREAVALRGWTDEIEAMALLYSYDDDGVPQYPVSMGEIAFEGAVETPVVRDWYTLAASRWTRLMYGRRGWWIAWGWLFWIVAVWFAVKLAVFAVVIAAMFALFMLTAVYDLATYRWRRRR